jgi:hypothetical protein
VVITKSKEQSPQEANISSASSGIPRIVWNPKVHHRVHNSPPTTTHPTPYILKICFIIEFPPSLGFPCDLHQHHHHLLPWFRSFDRFRRRRVAIVSWGAHDLFFLEVCSWGRVSGVWRFPFFQDGWSSFVSVWISRLVFQRSLVLILWLRFLLCLVLCML